MMGGQGQITLRPKPNKFKAKSKAYPDHFETKARCPGGQAASNTFIERKNLKETSVSRRVATNSNLINEFKKVKSSNEYQ